MYPKKIPISFQKFNQGVLMMDRSHSMDPNVSNRQFLKMLTKKSPPIMDTEQFQSILFIKGYVAASTDVHNDWFV